MLKTHPPEHVHKILNHSDNGNAPEPITHELKREIFRKVLSMGLPSIASFLLMTIYDVTDIFWLAKIGAEPVAAVTIVASFIWVLTFPNMIIGSGSVAIISRRFGEGNIEGTEHSIKNTFTAKMVVGIFLGLVGLIFLRPALRFLGADPAVFELGVTYAIPQLIICGFTLVSFSIYTAFRGIGRPAVGMWISVMGAVVNLVLDPLLIFGIGPFPELGILGASIASALGYSTVVITGCLLLSGKHSPVRVRWFGGLKPDIREMLRMMKIGFPSGMNSLSFALFSSISVKLVATYGTSVIALFGMSQRLLRFGVMIVVGLGLGTGALIGQFLGGRQLHRAWLSAILSLRLAVISMSVFALLILIFAPLIVRFFFTDPELYPTGTIFLRILAVSIPFVGLHIGVENIFSGAGMNVPPMLLGMATDWLFIIPFMYTIGEILKFGPAGMLVGITLGHGLGALIGIIIMRRGKWLMHRV
jgi:putative MATE family efflux protein